MSSWWTHITEEDAYNGGQEGRRGRESGEVEEDRNELGKRKRERVRERERARETERWRQREKHRENEPCHSAKPPSFGSIELIICNSSSQGIHSPLLASAGTRQACGAHICMQEKHTQKILKTRTTT
jgi:hypothetical protein